MGLLQKALVIDDEASIRKLLHSTLKQHGIDVVEAGTGKDGIAQAIATRPDFILLDLGLPDQDGTEVLKSLREWFRRPILILSVRDQEENIVQALDGGADDYLTKPFSMGELIARIRVAERHYQPESSSSFKAGSVEIDLVSRRVTRNGKEVHLTSTEYDVLKALVRNAGKVLTHRQLLHEVWGPNSAEHVQYLRVYIGHLRQKLEDNPNNPSLIATEPGVGYRMVIMSPSESL